MTVRGRSNHFDPAVGFLSYKFELALGATHLMIEDICKIEDLFRVTMNMLCSHGCRTIQDESLNLRQEDNGNVFLM
jgi:hypothetical protein